SHGSRSTTDRRQPSTPARTHEKVSWRILPWVGLGVRMSINYSTTLLIAKRFDGIEMGGAAGREVAEDDAHQAGKGEGDNDDGGFEHERQVMKVRADQRADDAKRDAKDAAQGRDHHRLHQE